MSLDLQVYTKHISNDFIPKIVSRLNDFEMICEVDPSFSFEDQSGFLPFKFQLTNPPFDILKGKVLTSGFELFIEDFDFEKQKEKAKPKQGLMDKLFGKKQPDNPLFTSDIDNRIKDCKKLLTFVWHVGDSFELRFASLTSAIVTELTNGVCCYPADDIWYNNENFVESTWKDIKDYETNLLKERALKYHEFAKW
jgi:hypothetical protein